MSDYALRINNVSKKFCKRLRYTMMYGTLDLTSTFFSIHQNFDRLRKGEFWALKDIEFEVKKGEAVGLIGANGAGKSTMLKLLNGIYMPDHGSIEVYGRVGALIQVGAGFHPMLTGRENIYVNGEILGMRKKYIDKHFDEIVDFSGIEDFIDTPVKHYSSGMYVRLGFAVVAFCQPEILLVDEVLAVGDAKFRRKCLDHLLELQKQGVTFIIVSHNMSIIEGIASKGIFFHKGTIEYCGNSVDAISKYELEMYVENKPEEKPECQPDFKAYPDSLPLLKYVQEYGTHDVHIKSLKVLDPNGKSNRIFYSDENLRVQATIDSKVSGKARVRLSFRNESDVDCLGTIQDFSLEKGIQDIKFTFTPLQLTTGKYKIVFVIHDESLVNPYCNGYYGCFDVANRSSANMKGIYTPHCWAYPEVKLIHKS